MKIIECPRDAMQGLHQFIPTEKKVEYINQLLKVGFDTIDFGSFVSPKAIPQLRDTTEVLGGLDLSNSSSKLLAIVANVQGAKEGAQFDEITYLGYPLSLSDTFQQRNTNRSIDQAFDDLAEIKELAESNDQEVVVYLSMGFGNPYGDPYEIDFIDEFVDRLDDIEIGIISLADTIGVSNAESIIALFGLLIPKYPHIDFGAHLHSTAEASLEKIEAAYVSGCRRMDGAIMGLGGCPMAEDKLVGNIATEQIFNFLKSQDVEAGLDQNVFIRSIEMASGVFGQF